MNIELSEVLDLARKWKKKATKISGSIFTNTQELQITFFAGISVDDDTTILISEGVLEIHLRLGPAMEFRYAESILEIRHPNYRCVLRERNNA